MEWIELEKEKPNIDEIVLGKDEFSEIQVCKLENRWIDKPEQFYVKDIYLFFPKYWMKLPL